MRKMQMLQEGQKTVRMTSTFKGYNHNEIISDGEMYWTKNLSVDGYPAVRPRRKRGLLSFDTPSPLTGISSLDGLVYTKGQSVYYKGQYVSGISVSDQIDMWPKQIINFGAYVCIWPDLVYFSTIDEKDRGTIDRKWAAKDHVTEGSNPPIDAPSAIMCRGDGTDYGANEITKSNSAPANPNDKDLWLDTHGENDVLRQYTADTSEWVEVATTFVKISANDIGKGIRQYDTVTISGLEATRTGTQPSDKHKKQLAALNGDNIIYFCGNDYIVIAGLLSRWYTLNHNTLEANREVPDMDYLCVSNNRMWGCRYGVDRKQQRLWSGTAADVSAYLCDEYGTVYTYQNITESQTAPENPQENDLWMDISNSNFPDAHLNKYKKYGSSYKWERIETYVKLSAGNIGKGLTETETVEISGLEWPDSGYVNRWLSAQIYALNGKKEIIKADEDYIVIPGIINGGYGTCGYQDKQAHVDKKAPISTFVNEIRASKLGDFKNWSSYMGLSTDSYTVSVGTEGPFTGTVTQWGYPIFFKENCLHRINGNTPSSFQVQTTMCKGVQQGSWRSIATANEVVYYKSKHEVMGYDGNMPISISEQLGNIQYEDARAGIIGSKYYISMKDANGLWNQFCYDTKRNIWYREDYLMVLGYAADGDELYAIDETVNRLIGINGHIFNQNSRGQTEDTLEWEAVFGISGIEYADSMYGTGRTDSRNQMYMSRFDIRMYLEDGAEATLWIMYDDGEWRKQGTVRGTKTRSFMLPVIPRRCDHLRFKLTGRGDFRLYSISRILEEGSDG